MIALSETEQAITESSARLGCFVEAEMRDRSDFVVEDCDYMIGCLLFDMQEKIIQLTDAITTNVSPREITTTVTEYTEAVKALSEAKRYVQAMIAGFPPEYAEQHVVCPIGVEFS
jgi:hypothetical protein